MKKYIAWIFVIAWMALIFSFSAQSADGSMELSTGISQEIIETIEDIFQKTDIDIGIIHYVLRKGAHLFLYFVLGVLVYCALRVSGFEKRTIIIGLIICVIYAASDEIHQLYVPGRGPKVADVFIDGFGSLIGIIAVRFVFVCRNKKARKVSLTQ